MGLRINATFSGAKEAERSLKRLKRGAANKIARRALSKSSTVVLKAVKDNVPRREGLLKKSLGRKVFTTKTKGRTMALVGPRMGFKIFKDGKPIDPVKYAHIVEFGRKAVIVKRRSVLSDGERFFGDRVKPAPARSFIRRGWDSQRHSVEYIIAAEVQAGIKEAVHNG